MSKLIATLISLFSFRLSKTIQPHTFGLQILLPLQRHRKHEKDDEDQFGVKIHLKTQHEYVIEVKDELTKNHRDPEEIVSGVIPENRTDV